MLPFLSANLIYFIVAPFVAFAVGLLYVSIEDALLRRRSKAGRPARAALSSSLRTSERKRHKSVSAA